MPVFNHAVYALLSIAQYLSALCPHILPCPSSCLLCTADVAWCFPQRGQHAEQLPPQPLHALHPKTDHAGGMRTPPRHACMCSQQQQRCSHCPLISLPPVGSVCGLGSAAWAAGAILHGLPGSSRGACSSSYAGASHRHQCSADGCMGACPRPCGGRMCTTAVCRVWSGTR